MGEAEDQSITEDRLKILLGLYAAERSEGAAMMTAGNALGGMMLAYVGVLTAVAGTLSTKAVSIPAPLILLTTVPVLIIFLLFLVHSFNQGLRATSGRTLEQMIWLKDPHFLAQTVGQEWQNLSVSNDGRNQKDSSHYFAKGDSTRLREVAFGLHTTELFYNADQANRNQSRFLVACYAVVSVAVLVFVAGVTTLAWHVEMARSQSHWQFAVVGALIVALLVLALIATVSGARHRSRAESAATFLLAQVEDAIGQPRSRPDQAKRPSLLSWLLRGRA